jgi:thermostable 8-oxoguanine DNA glycosylase
MTEGHRFRVGCAQKIIDLKIPNVDLYGVGIREVQGKIEGLRDYKFSIAIENGVHDNYFTEKILDCFLTGVIPIYRGCKNISEFFNTKGFLIFNTEEELLEIINNLTEQDYLSREEYIKENFEKAKQYAYDNDQLFNKYFKKLIN